MTGNDFINAGLKYLGTPYVWGGTTKSGGMDCSGFVYRVLKDCGLDVNRLTAQGYYNSEQSTVVKSTTNGDLLFFGTSTKNITHIGFYYNGKLLESGGGGSANTSLANAGVGVRVRSMRNDLVAVKRLNVLMATSGISKGGTYYMEFPLIKYGANNKYVTLCQRLLKIRGYYTDNIDGVYGPNTQKAVSKFQSDFPACGGADGECGVKTWPQVLGIV